MALFTLTEHRLHPQLTRLDISNAHASASLSLLGGQLLSFVPRSDGRERLFVSPTARWDGSKPVRGGIPVCWPWFGAHPEGGTLPAHGYVRTRPWHLLETSEHANHTRLLLAPLDTAGPGFAGTAELQLEVLVGTTLTLNLRTRNTGPAPLRLGTALHTYFKVSDVRQCLLHGLQGTYTDKNLDWAMGTTPAPYRFTAATDRIHLHAAEVLGIEDGAERTTIRSAGHDSIVVWNPWEGCSRQFTDLGEDAWPRMLCVETAVTQGFSVEPGESHSLSQIIG